MPRALFEKTGRAIYISHLDLMRVFQRAFKRAGLPLTHTQGYNPRPSVSIALPLSVGVESMCELLDFDLEGAPIPCQEICSRLNEVLVEGVHVLQVYEDAAKIKHLAYLDSVVTLEYDNGVPAQAAAALESLFNQPEVLVEKRSKNGTKEENIIPMIRHLTVEEQDDHTITLSARICCQNPTLNPNQLVAAISKYLPDLAPDYSSCRRVEVYNTEEKLFR